MSKIIVKNPSQEELDALNIQSWSPWGCGISRFDWEYPEDETCYVFEGQVTVETKDGNVEINSGDLVFFPKGLQCVWDVKKPIKKVYKFS